MSKAKTRIDQKTVERFLKKYLRTANVAPEAIADGETSQTFFFESLGGPRVLRVNSVQRGFLKDSYAAKHFSSKSIPVPSVLEIGELEKGVFFAISEKAAGKTLDKFNKEEIQRLIFMQFIHLAQVMVLGNSTARVNITLGKRA